MIVKYISTFMYLHRER